MDRAEAAKRLMDVFRRFRRLMKGPPMFSGLKPSEMALLFHVLAGNQADAEGIKVSELAGRMHVTSPSVTQLVTGLEERGLVVRRMDPEDRRIVLVSLTDRGGEVIQLAESHFLGVLNGIVGHMGLEKSLLLADLMEDVFDYLSTLQKPGKET